MSMKSTSSRRSSISRISSEFEEILQNNSLYHKPSVFDEAQPFPIEDETEKLSPLSRFWEKMRYQDHSQQDQTPTYDKNAIILLSFYVPLITIPWILSCIMAHRPLVAPSYYDQRGLSNKEVKNIQGWMTAVNIFNAVAGIVTVPIISALLAQAAAVYTERYWTRKELRPSDLCALADRAWTNPFAMVKFGASRTDKSLSPSFRTFLFFASFMILLGSVQQPLYQILVSVDTISIATCRDVTKDELDDFEVGRQCDFDQCQIDGCHSKEAIGWDIEPKEMARIEQGTIIDKLIKDLPGASVKEKQVHVWNDSMVQNQPTVGSALLDMSTQNWPYFVAGLQQGTRTGVMREHIMRFNSSLKCEHVERSQFPSTCGGTKPFTKTFSRGRYVTRICVPGNFTAHPWTFSRNRQDITEELYLDAFEEEKVNDGRGGLFSNFTLHCKASTTRGYFELGNYRNNYTWGPLLEVWPDVNEMRNNFNDIVGGRIDAAATLPTADGDIYMHEEHIYKPVVEGFDINDLPENWRVPGPLTTVAIALFGNQSFMETASLAYNRTINFDDDDPLPYLQICNTIPFARFQLSVVDMEGFPICTNGGMEASGTTSPIETWEDLKYYRLKWVHSFDDTQLAEQALSAAVFLVNQALLTRNQWDQNFLNTYCDPSPGEDCSGMAYRSGEHAGRTIYSSKGTKINKPNISNTGIIIMSVYLFVQLVALAALTWQIYRVPSTISSLKASTVTRLLEGLKERKEGM